MKNYAVYNRNRYLISLKGGITYVFSHNYPRIKIDLYYSLLLEEASTLHKVVIVIKSVFNKNRYYYNIFLEKCSHHLP